MTIRNTKIIASLGPASNSKETIEKLIREGIDIARINFSHGNHREHSRTIALVQETSHKMKKPVAILQDLCGPKLRIDAVYPDPVAIKKGAHIALTDKKCAGSSRRISFSSIPGIAGMVKKNHRILIDDGAVTLTVLEKKKNDIICRIETDGFIGSHKGIRFPDAHLPSLPSLTRKDKEDLIFGLQKGVDFVALSFVRSPDDIKKIKKIIKQHGKNTPVIAKIEKKEALEHLESIIALADGIMVARGDLGVETDLATVVLNQKKIIKLCNVYGKPVITATQMLESMIEKPTPTRAEVADITNAIFDGTDALMLSGETAVGKYPVRAVAVMAEIAEKTEDSLDYNLFLSRKPLSSSVSDAVAHAACQLAREVNADVILVPTISGSTARMISRYRPLPPIITVTPDRKILNQLKLVWGVYPFKIPYTKTTDSIIHEARRAALRSGMVKRGAKAVICAGNPAGRPGTTDLIKLEHL